MISIIYQVNMHSVQKKNESKKYKLENKKLCLLGITDPLGCKIWTYKKKREETTNSF